MADDRSIEELQKELRDRTEERERLRRERQASLQEQQDAIVRAQLRAEIEKVEQDIRAEQEALATQLGTNIDQVAVGVVPEPAPEPPTPPDETPPENQQVVTGPSGDTPDSQEGSN